MLCYRATPPPHLSIIPYLLYNFFSRSLAPELANPEVYSTNSRIPTLTAEINNILDRLEYSNNLNKLLEAIAPNCTQFILECQVGPTSFTGEQCCGKIFDPNPIFTRYGTCFSTKMAQLKHEVSVAGEGSGLTVVTMHDSGKLT